MASPCVVYYCTNIGTHRFPKDDLRKAQWIEAIKYVKPWITIGKNSFICSAHFLHTDYGMNSTWYKDIAPKRLKQTAIPSVFPWTHAPGSEKQTQHSIPSATTLIFDPSKAQATYSRTPSVAYVEMQSFLDTPTELLEDPLQDLQVLNLKEEFQETEMDINNLTLQVQPLDQETELVVKTEFTHSVWLQFSPSP